MRKILICGCGFIGRNLFEKLSKNKDDIVIGICRKNWFNIDNIVHIDLLDFEQTKKYINYFQPDIIYHLAAYPYSQYDPLVQKNIDITFNILNSINKPCDFIFASSATVYGNIHLSNITGAYEGDKENPHSIYGGIKLACENICKSYCNLRKIKNLVILRLIANTGKYQSHGVIIDLINKIKNIDSNKTLEVIGAYPGTNKQYMHISDTIDALKCFGFSAKEFCVNNQLTLNISTNDCITIDEIVQTLLKKIPLSTCSALRWTGNTWEGDNWMVNLNNSLAKSFGWEPKLSSKQAIELGIKELL